MKRVSITIEVNCDRVPGWGYDPEDWRRHFQNHINEGFPWYDPRIVDFKVMTGEEALKYKRSEAS